MDLPQADYTDTASEPLELVEAILTDEGLTFERTPDGEVLFSLAGLWKSYDMWFSCRPEGECLQLCSSLDLRFDPPKFPAIHQLLSLVNQRVWFGHFEIYEDEDGVREEGRLPANIVFRHTLLSSPMERPGQVQTAHMINVAAEAVDRFYPAFDFLFKGAKTADDALEACLFETIGEA